MYQAIVTRYHGATNTRGARIKASADGHSVTLPWDHSVGAQENHAAACLALLRKMAWAGDYYSGGLAGSDNVWVCCNIVRAKEGVHVVNTNRPYAEG